MFMGDYSQAEMRVAAAMSEDPFLLDAYRQGKDLHNEAARTIYGDEYTKRNRQVCKSVNFSQIYGGSVESAASEADMDRAALAHLSSSYHEMYARLYQWKDDQFAQLKRVGYVSTPTGRRRRFPLITNANRDEARKASVNAPVQGTASELTLISLIRMYDEIQIIGWQEYVHLLLTIHDSIVGEVHPAYLMGVAKLLRRIMVETGAEYFPQLPWVVDIEAGFAWGELKTLEVVG
jgi:DNA polymerase-1